MEVLLIATILGWIRGGKVANLFKADIKGVPLFFTSLLLTVLLYNAISPTSHLIPILYLSSFLLILAGIHLNQDLPGQKLMLIGVSINLLVIALNDFKMPVTEKLLLWTTEAEFLASSQALTHSIMEPGTRLKLLSDVIIIPPGFFGSGIYSLGDLILYLGIIYAISTKMSEKTKETGSINKRVSPL